MQALHSQNGKQLESFLLPLNGELAQVQVRYSLKWFLKRDGFINTLRHIHHVGYSHNNLRAKSLYIDTRGRVSIIGLGHASKESNKDMAVEGMDLRHLLA
jgi:hypothetical protein